MKTLILICLMLTGCSSLFYKPHGGPYTTDRPNFVEAVTFETEGNLPLKGFLLKSKTPSKGIVIHFHGNTGNAETYFIFLEWLVVRGYDVLTFDYRGYGESPGSPSRKGLVQDSHAAIEYVVKQKKWDNIYLFGQSLGGNQAIAVVDETNRHFIDGIIIDCTFYSYASIANYNIGDTALTYPLSWLLVGGNSYSAANNVANLHVPTLFIHGDKDEMIPISHGYRLFSEASFPKQFVAVPSCGHVEAISKEYVRDIIVHFLEANSLDLDYINGRPSLNSPIIVE